ncbi:flagellar motor stator protein MotA [Cellvibrio fontiphilus]|uniref:Flagellar motor stator protein MotA n=1 Tax=Cellvibrio fontiphilus TaxID=1815559 RepID=A0ABV7FFC5_9GAMM
MNIILGIIVVLGCVIGGFAVHGGNPMALMSPIEVLIICGASFGAMIIGNPLSVTIGVIKSGGSLMTPSKFNKVFYLELLTLLYDILNKTRREGLMAIEGDIEEPETSPIFANYASILKDHHIVEFICDYLRIMVAGNMAPHELESLMEQELEGHHTEASVVPGAIQNAADGLPGFGIVAAVLGVIITMGKIGGPPAEIGAAVAAALVGTLLGILFAYGFIAPFSSYLQGKVRDEGRAYECIKAVLVASMNGVPPQVAVEFGRKVLFHSVRPSFKELEEQYRASKK